jgi:hypothetical protein
MTVKSISPVTLKPISSVGEWLKTIKMKFTTPKKKFSSPIHPAASSSEIHQQELQQNKNPIIITVYYHCRVYYRKPSLEDYHDR